MLEFYYVFLALKRVLKLFLMVFEDCWGFLAFECHLKDQLVSALFKIASFKNR